MVVGSVEGEREPTPRTVSAKDPGWVNRMCSQDEAQEGFSLLAIHLLHQSEVEQTYWQLISPGAPSQLTKSPMFWPMVADDDRQESQNVGGQRAMTPSLFPAK